MNILWRVASADHMGGTFVGGIVRDLANHENKDPTEVLCISISMITPPLLEYRCALTSSVSGLQYCHRVPIDSVALLAHTFKFFAECRLPRVLVDMIISNAAHRCTYRAALFSENGHRKQIARRLFGENYIRP